MEQLELGAVLGCHLKYLEDYNKDKSIMHRMTKMEGEKRCVGEE
jgi:hypothetical protein